MIVHDLKTLNYWELLAMRVYSVERRFQRYAIIYIWKIMENQVQNYGLKWTSNDRKGKMVDIPKKSDS